MKDTKDILKYVDQNQNTFHTGAILDIDTKISGVSDVKSIINLWSHKGQIAENEDEYDVTTRAYKARYPNDSVAILKPNAKINLLYPKQYFISQGIDQPKWVSGGANMLGNQWDNLELGLLRDEGYSETKLDELKEKTVDSSLIHKTLQFAKGGGEVVNSLANKWEQKLVDDIKKGNADNMFTQLIPMSEGEDGYYIATFFHRPDTPPETAELVGGMINKDTNSLHIISKEELAGASLSEQLLQYVQSWYFDYNHENIRNLYEIGRQKGGTGDHGWWNPTGGFFNDDKSSVEGDWMMDNLRRTIHLLTTKVGDSEFKYAVKPLYDMMGKKLAGINSNLELPERRDNLNEEEAQDVLIQYMDTLDRSYKRGLKNEPLSWLQVPARFISNLYEIHLNPRELFN